MLSPLWAESWDNSNGVYLGVGGTTLLIAVLAGVAAVRIAHDR